jgi:hypothetical protein
MLTFEEFHCTNDGCFIWAGETVTGRRVRFGIGGALILQDVLQSGPVNGLANEALCDRERRRIEAACRRAFVIRPSEHIELEPGDFNDDEKPDRTS